MTHFKNYFKGRLSCKFCYKLLVKDPTIPKSRCYGTLPCNLSLITAHVSGCCCFSDIYISQGIVATHLRGSGIFYYRFTTNLLRSLSVKESGISGTVTQSSVSNHGRELSSSVVYSHNCWVALILDSYRGVFPRYSYA